MRVMDGLMAIPGILLAVAMLSRTRASVQTVIIAIAIPEIPRVVRLVRAVVLSINILGDGVRDMLDPRIAKRL